jgi:O-antigen ligase
MDKRDTVFSTERLGHFLEQCIPWLIGIFLFFNPFPHTTAIKEISFYLCLLSFPILLAAKKGSFLFRTPLLIPFILFVVWSCLGLFFAFNKANTFHDIYAHLLKYLFIFFMVSNFFDSRKRFSILAWIFVVSATIFAVTTMTYDYVILHRSLTDKLAYVFPETSPNIAGIITLFSILLSFSLFSKRTPYLNAVLLISLCLSAFATLATQARSAVLALIAAFSVMFPARKKTFVLIFVAVLVLAVSFLPVKNLFTPEAIITKLKADDRIAIWLCYAEIIKDHPVFGVGFGMQTCYDENLLKKYNARVPEEHRMTYLYNAPHNLLVDTATRTGLVGLALFLYILFSFVKMGWHLIRNGRNEFIRDWSLCIMGTFVAVFVQGMFENTLSGPPAVILYSIFAMMTILWRMQHEPPGVPQAGASASNNTGEPNA